VFQARHAYQLIIDYLLILKNPPLVVKHGNGKSSSQFNHCLPQVAHDGLHDRFIQCAAALSENLDPVQGSCGQFDTTAGTNDALLI
jgi:hypothetical protein